MVTNLEYTSFELMAVTGGSSSGVSAAYSYRGGRLPVAVTRSEPPRSSPRPSDDADLLVGRGYELAPAMDAIAIGVRLVWIRGPVGAGKTKLLSRIARACRERALPYYWLAPRVEPPTSAALSAIAAELGQGTGRAALLIDDFELLRPIEPWFFERFVPSLAGSAALVIATRGPAPRPPPAGCAAVDLELRGLGDGEIELYLDDCRATASST